MEMYNMHEAKTHLSQIIAMVSNGEEVIIGKAGKPVAKIVPYEENKEPRKLGGEWEGKIWISDDFDAEDGEIIKMFYGEDSE